LSAAVTIRRAVPADVEPLTALVVRAFHQAYDAKSPAVEVEAHVARHFTREKIAAEVADAEAIMLLAEVGEDLVGYAYLRPGATEACVSGPDPVELCRIYFDETVLGMGYAAVLMERLLEAARAAGGRTIWLSVWEENHRAIRFYEKWGFAWVGTHDFDFGGTLYQDPIMARALS
jgi:ribosomal protein S18 acetylase RimI-like enzyme